MAAVTGHERSSTKNTNDWGTPLWLVEALGEFDLDPCGRAGHPTAHGIWEGADGLEREWQGRVWMNPPYGPFVGKWLDKLAAHGDGMALIFARTETKNFMRSVWGKADAVLFLFGRVAFLRLDGTPAPNSAGAPSCLVAYGQRNVEALERAALAGALIKDWRVLTIESPTKDNIQWLSL